MAMSNPYQQYQQNSIFTARPEELTLMLYNGAIKFLKQARINIQESQIDKANNNILRAEDILTELKCTLDMQYEVSNNLYALYDFMHGWLVQANINKLDGGIEKIDDVLRLLEELRNTWSEAMKIAKTSRKVEQE